MAVRLPGDWDGDSDVDLADYAAMAPCLTGPDGPPFTGGCGVFDFDSDTDIDLSDFADFQVTFGS